MKDKILLIICIIVFLGSVAYLGNYFLQTKQSEEKYDELAGLIQTSDVTKAPTLSPVPTATLTPTPTEIPEEEPEEVSPTLLPTATPTPTLSPTPTPYVPPEVIEKYKALSDLSSDFVGWISIEDTVVDYPVMQRDNEFYLSHDFYGEYSYPGSIFVDESCSIGPRSTNVMLYGHNMKAGTMFAALHNYKEESFWENHRYIRFDTIYEEAVYEVAAVFLGQVYKTTDREFKFYKFVDAANEEEFDYYADNVKALQLYDTGVELKYGDELISLITCSYHVEDKLGRLVVVAKKVEAQ